MATLRRLPNRAAAAPSGVFDLTGCHFGDGEMDLARTTTSYLDEDPALAREFVKTYLDLCPPRSGFAQRFPAYMVIERLIIWEYLQRTAPEKFAGISLRDWAGRYTRALEPLEL